MQLEDDLRAIAMADGLLHVPDAGTGATIIHQTWSFDDLEDTIIAKAKAPPTNVKAEPSHKKIKKSSTPIPYDCDAASISLPLARPDHLKQLLRDYFAANNTDQVPSEIYCLQLPLQLPRIFQTFAKESPAGKLKQAVFVSHAMEATLILMLTH